ncbi:MAG TPA: cupin domain-containing protein [Thermomicrobiales bacterium]|jgi:hypothetical protein|nr:cupin domain-containing protein [Thermomicrobiales bacterium]
MAGMSADEVIERLGLEPLVGEGGMFRETWQLHGISPGSPPMATAIYYLLTDAMFSEFHRLQSDEIYHFYLGDPVELTTLGPGDAIGRYVLGQDLVAGMDVQRVVPAGAWQGSQLRAGGKWALMGTTMTPGYNPDRYERGEARLLRRRWPDAAAEIDALTRA